MFVLGWFFTMGLVSCHAWHSYFMSGDVWRGNYKYVPLSPDWVHWCWLICDLKGFRREVLKESSLMRNWNQYSCTSVILARLMRWVEMYKLSSHTVVCGSKTEEVFKTAYKNTNYIYCFSQLTSWDALKHFDPYPIYRCHNRPLDQLQF